MFLSRVQLTPELLGRSDLASMLRRGDYGMHQLLWKLFSSEENNFTGETAPYLFRQESGREQVGARQTWPLFYVQSTLRPKENLPWFRVECKPFQPRLQTGDRLSFRLRANPTIARRQQGKKNTVRHDVVMDAKLQHLLRLCLEHDLITEQDIHAGSGRERKVVVDSLKRKQLEDRLLALSHFAEPGAHATFRQQQSQAAEQAVLHWLEKKAESSGFELESGTVQATGHLWHSLTGAGKKRHAGYSSMDYQGVLKVVDAEIFLDQLRQGFGPAKRFGCGMMLIRRAPADICR